MGCSESKIENEETVSRCKDRKQFMKSSVVSRNAFAAAHSSYAISLKNTGAALTDFSAGEFLVSNSGDILPPQPQLQTLPPPPPPIPGPTIDDEEEENGLRRRRKGGGASPPPPPPPPEMGGPSWEFFFNVDNMNNPRGNLVNVVGNEKYGHARKVFDEMPDTNVDRSLSERVVQVKEDNRLRLVSNSGAEVKKGSVNLVQVFSDLDDCFLATSESAQEVTKLLEAARLHFHSNFADKTGHIDHSARVMQVITWNRSIKGLANAVEFNDDFDSEENETHATVLDKLLAWEKKLYDEVKAGEIMKFEYQRKVSLLNKQKKRGVSTEALEKIKATVSHLHTRYIVDMQTMDSTVSEINRLRDQQLYPKLVSLVDAMATMWGALHGYHEKQLNIAHALRAADMSKSSKETTDHHHDRTIQLWGVVQEWHMQFDKMVNHQKDYIKALNSWLKLNLIPIESSLKEKVSSPPRAQKPPIQNLLLAWHDLLEKLPDEHAKSAIHNFGEVLHTIVQQQEDELKLRAKVEESVKDLEKKQRQYNKWLREYTQRRGPSDEMEAHEGEEGVPKDEIMIEKEFVVENAKKKLDEDRENYERQCLHVREKSLTSLKTRLPELFRALSDFGRASSEMYKNLKSISDSKSHEGRETAA